MGLFSSKQKTDPAHTASQKSSNQIMQMMEKQTLPALPALPGPAAPTLNVPYTLPSYLGGGAAMTYGAGAMPNQLSMIANQLTAGGYGAPDQSMYRAQTVAPYVPPPPPPPPPAPAPVAAAVPAPAPALPAAPAVKSRGFTGMRPSTPFQSFSDFANFIASYRR